MKILTRYNCKRDQHDKYPCKKADSKCGPCILLKSTKHFTATGNNVLSKMYTTIIIIIAERRNFGSIMLNDCKDTL